MHLKIELHNITVNLINLFSNIFRTEFLQSNKKLRQLNNINYKLNFCFFSYIKGPSQLY